MLDNRATKWVYTLARLLSVTGHAITEVVDLAAGSTIGGVAIGTGSGGVQEDLVVYEATGTAVGELVSSVALPANYLSYKYVHMTEYDATNLQWRHAEFATAVLEHVYVNDSIRLQGNTTVSWTVGTRTITMGGSVQEIFRISLKD